MFCPHCGANIPDDSKCCSNCGARLVDDSSAKQGAASTVPAGLSKGKYLASFATPKTKTFGLVSRLAALLCAVLFVVSYIAAMNTSIEDLPIITNIAGLAGADVDELKDAKSDMKDALDEMEEIFEEAEDKLSSDEKKACERVIDATKDFSKSMSINNTKNVVKAVEKFGKLDFDDAKEVESIVKNDIDEAVESVEEVLDAISAVVLWFMIIPCVFTVLGGLFRIRGLVITGLIFLFFYGFTFCPLVLFVILVIVHAALIFITSKINGEYKAYRAATFGK